MTTVSLSNWVGVRLCTPIPVSLFVSVVDMCRSFPIGFLQLPPFFFFFFLAGIFTRYSILYLKLAYDVVLWRSTARNDSWLENGIFIDH